MWLNVKIINYKAITHTCCGVINIWWGRTSSGDDVFGTLMKWWFLKKQKTVKRHEESRDESEPCCHINITVHQTNRGYSTVMQSIWLQVLFFNYVQYNDNVILNFYICLFCLFFSDTKQIKAAFISTLKCWQSCVFRRLFIYLKPVPLCHKKIGGGEVIWDQKICLKNKFKKIVLLVSAIFIDLFKDLYSFSLLHLHDYLFVIPVWSRFMPSFYYRY